MPLLHVHTTPDAFDDESHRRCVESITDAALRNGKIVWVREMAANVGFAHLQRIASPAPASAFLGSDVRNVG